MPTPRPPLNTHAAIAPVSSRTPPGSAHIDENVKQAWFALLIRLHLYVGLFVGPFIFVAAFSGLVYVLTPQLEDTLYAQQLFTPSMGPAQPLERQVQAARDHMAGNGLLVAIRPAPGAGSTTRVIFNATEAGASESRAIFIDPVTNDIRGDLVAYGTSGVLPLRTWLSHVHRSLMLGEWGRAYSELAASWLGLAGLSGLAMWMMRRRQLRRADSSTVPASFYMRRWHVRLGLWLLVALLLVSATGLTWSKWAGGNISLARAALGMSTPTLSTSIDETAIPQADAQHHHADPGAVVNEPVGHVHAAANIDAVLHAARMAGITAEKIEIRPPRSAQQAWSVTEIDRSWPTRVDAVALAPGTLAVIDKLEFDRFPLAAKLTRWGIDLHMGILFGIPNQLLLVAIATGLLTLVVWGYLMWWRRRAQPARLTMWQALRRLPMSGRIAFGVLAALLGYCLPMVGASLAGFLLLDGIILRTQDPRHCQLPH